MGLFKEFCKEDAPTNTIGGGAVATYEKPLTKKVVAHGSFAGHAVFDVDHDTIWKSRLGKDPHHRYSRYVGKDQLGEDIRQYARSHPGEGIVLRNSKTGAMTFLRRKSVKK